MTADFAREILSWKYEPPYDFYNNDPTEEALNELLSYIVVVDEINQLVGFYCSGKSAQVPAGNKYGVYHDNMIDCGLGLKPELTGKGLGKSFFTWILHNIENSQKLPIRLTVATFNTRAIKLYESQGFMKEISFDVNGIEFQTMIKTKMS
jgi:[ribosomal protein S18]-alanine N-acetyltransferase